MQTNILEYLEATVQRLPDKPAYCDNAVQLTFRQTADAARAIGSQLLRDGFYKEPVVVFMKKQPAAVAAFYGAVYAGCYYVPLDEEMPQFRISLIFDTLGPRAVICDEATEKIMGSIPNFSGRLYRFSEIAASPVDEAALAAVRKKQIDTDPIYIVFTSGSTGVPKGVVACHRSVLDYIEALSDTLGFSESTVFANQTPLYFDACLKELYPTMKFGATTWFVPKQLFMFPTKLVEYLNTHKINTVCWVVSALTMISSFGTLDTIVPQYLHTVAFGSEVFPIRQFRLWRKALPNARFTNLYGPTECTGMSCFYHVEREFADDERIPIGEPFRNTEILLLDANDRVPAAGESGEICIRGTSLTLGYFRQFDKTDEVFVQNPLNHNYPERIYRTGDIGKYNERGELVFLSRKDYQIKHMGHRIELGELDLAASMLDGVRAACAIYDEARSKIVLFYAGSMDKREPGKHLRARLPRYMLPNVIHQLEALPLTPNGKTDRKRLRQLHEEATISP